MKGWNIKAGTKKKSSGYALLWCIPGNSGGNNTQDDEYIAEIIAAEFY